MRRKSAKPKILITYVGYVAQTEHGPVARVRARVLRRTVLAAAAAAGPVRAWRTFLETVAWFASAEVPGVPVEVTSDRETVRVVSDDEGYVEARVPVGPPDQSRSGCGCVRPAPRTRRPRRWSSRTTAVRWWSATSTTRCWSPA